MEVGSHLVLASSPRDFQKNGLLLEDFERFLSDSGFMSRKPGCCKYDTGNQHDFQLKIHLHNCLTLPEG